MKKLKAALMLMVFCGIGIFLLTCITNVLIPKWPYLMDGGFGVGTRFRDFYRQPEGTLDYVVVGSSHTNFAINPMQIYEETGYTGYVLGGESQAMANSYYWVMEAHRKHNIKAVFVDVSTLIQESDYGSLILKELLSMEPSELKFRAIMECSPDKETVYSALFPIYSFHERWTKLGKDNFLGIDESDYYLRGSALRFYSSNQYLSDEVGVKEKDVITIDENGNVVVSEERMGIDEKSSEYLKKIIDYCEDNGIKVVPVKCPSKRWNKRWSDEVSAYLESLGRDKLLDMTRQSDLILNWDTDTVDDGYHLSYIGNVKTSHWFAAYLKNMGIFEDHRQTDGIWNETADTYLKWERSCIFDLLYPRQSIYKYLSSVAENSDKYMVVVSVNNDVSNFYYDEEMDQLFRRMGFDNGLSPEEQKSLIAIEDGGTEVILHSSFRKEQYDGSYTSEDGKEHSLSIISSSASDGDESSIMVDDTEHSDDVQGINIAVVDKTDGKVISRAGIGTKDNGAVTFEEHKTDVESSERFEKNVSDIIANYESGVLTTSGNGLSFKLVSVDNDSFLLKEEESGKVLAPQSFENIEGTHTELQEENGLAAQQWTVFTDLDGNIRILSLFADKYLSVDENGNFVLMEEYKKENGCFALKREAQ